MHAKTIALQVVLCLGMAGAGNAALAQQAAADAAGPAADNTAINHRDRAPSAAKATDQRNDRADVKLAAAVRQAIVHDKSLSMMAHNVKLVATSGAVTLRGPVRSDAEKAKVGEIASATDGVSKVDNQLDVKTK